MGLHYAFPAAEITGVDLIPQPKYPFKFIQYDACEFPLEGYDFIWASPPCQLFAKTNKLNTGNHPDLIVPIRQKLTVSGVPYCIENVPQAPLLNPIMLCGGMFGLKTYRHRHFETNFVVRQPYHPNHIHKQAKMGRPPKAGEFIQVVGNYSGAELAREAMEITWLAAKEMSQAIPPAFSRYIAKFIPRDY